MAFPSSNGTINENLSRGWDSLRDIAGNIKSRSINLKNALEASTATSDVILFYCGNIADMRARMVAIAAMPGMVAYAQSQINNPSYDVTAEFITMRNAIDAVISWVITNFPKDVSGFLLAQTFKVDNSGRLSQRVFIASQTVGLRAALDALIAAID